MIISHKHRYLFVELPRTGSTAIRRELRELYDGTPILHKHATYLEFARQASADERNYFVFSGIRWNIERPTRMHRLGYQGFRRMAQVYWRALRPRS